MGIPKSQQSIYPQTYPTTTTTTTFAAGHSGVSITGPNWLVGDMTTFTNPSDFYSITGPTDPVYAAFRELGLELFPSEAALIEEYLARYQRTLEQEVAEWFPIFARRRIVE